jgi:hypothetical protein
MIGDACVPGSQLLISGEKHQPMSNRVTIYGVPNSPDVKRLKREMHVMYVDYEIANPQVDDLAKSRLTEWGFPGHQGVVVEVQRSDASGSVFLKNPDEPTLRQTFYSEGILSVTSYWV